MARGESPDRFLWTAPSTVVAEWLALTELLEEVGPVPCQSSDAEAWWPDRKQADELPARMAVAACRQCPASGACLDYALAADERFGIWGGTTPDERRILRWNSGR